MNYLLVQREILGYIYTTRRASWFPINLGLRIDISGLIPMVRLRSWSAPASYHNRKLRQFDDVTAFLHGDVDSSIYMEFPEGFEEPGYVCWLQRSLYGLKQARGFGTNASTASWPPTASPWPNRTTVYSTNPIAWSVFTSMTFSLLLQPRMR
jgi:hypothetical protein